MTKIELDILVKILHNTERIIMAFADLKVALDGLVAAVDVLIGKLQGAEIVDPVEMQAAIDEVRAEMAKIAALP